MMKKATMEWDFSSDSTDPRLKQQQAADQKAADNSINKNKVNNHMQIQKQASHPRVAEDDVDFDDVIGEFD